MRRHHRCRRPVPDKPALPSGSSEGTITSKRESASEARDIASLLSVKTGVRLRAVTTKPLMTVKVDGPAEPPAKRVPRVFLTLSHCEFDDRIGVEPRTASRADAVWRAA